VALWYEREIKKEYGPRRIFAARANFGVLTFLHLIQLVLGF